MARTGNPAPGWAEAPGTPRPRRGTARTGGAPQRHGGGQPGAGTVRRRKAGRHAPSPPSSPSPPCSPACAPSFPPHRSRGARPHRAARWARRAGRLHRAAQVSTPRSSPCPDGSCPFQPPAARRRATNENPIPRAGTEQVRLVSVAADPSGVDRVERGFATTGAALIGPSDPPAVSVGPPGGGWERSASPSPKRRAPEWGRAAARGSPSLSGLRSRRAPRRRASSRRRSMGRREGLGNLGTRRFTRSRGVGPPAAGPALHRAMGRDLAAGLQSMQPR